MFTRRFTVRLTIVTAVVLAGSSSACNDSTPLSAPVAPTTDRVEKASIDRVIAVATVGLVRRTKALASSEITCGLVTPKGSSLSIRKAGLKVTFPVGAVSSPTNICLVAPAGVLVTYGFLPHGLHFNTDIAVQQDLHGTTAFHNATLASDLVGGYLANEVAKDVDANGVASFAQVFKVRGGNDADEETNERPSTARFYTNHFSGYALASGRSQ